MERHNGPFASDGTIVPLTITGSGFGATQSNSMVIFFESSTVSTIRNWSDSSITVDVPIDATTRPLSVQVGGTTAEGSSWFNINQRSEVTDSLGNKTQYVFLVQGGNGSWLLLKGRDAVPAPFAEIPRMCLTRMGISAAAPMT